MAKDWHPAPALLSLRASVNAEFPNRDKKSDGILGDAAHSARVSQHNPDYTKSGERYGEVRAADFDIKPDGREDLDLRTELLNSCVGNPAVWYCISNGIIYSLTNNWRAKKYTGSNAHNEHVHVSLRDSALAVNYPLKLKTRSLPPVKPTPGGSAPARDPLGNGDALLSRYCLKRIDQAQPVTGECMGDGRRIMAVARILGGTPAAELEVGWYSARHSEELARARGDEAAVKAHLRHQQKLFRQAVREIQYVGKLVQDGVIGPRTEAYLSTFGYQWKAA